MRICQVYLDPIHCSIESLSYRENPKAAEVSIPVTLHDGKITWNPPASGFVTVHFQQIVSRPTLSQAIDEKAFDVLQIIVENGRTDVDRRNWLRLLCQDISCTTSQAQQMIDRFKKNKTIGVGGGGLRTLDILRSLWKHLLDTENIFDLLLRNTKPQERRDLIYALTVNRYKFNWVNPTGNWRLRFDDNDQREIFLQIAAINTLESDYSKQHAHRSDTSQMG